MRSSVLLDRILRWMAALVASHHQDLVRGMLAELAAIPHVAEHRRFAWGAFFTVARLACSAQLAALLVDIGVLAPAGGVLAAEASIPMPPARQLLRRHVGPLVASLGVLTLLLLANYGARMAPQLSARVGGSGALVELLIFAVPFLLAMTLPMGVFLSVAWVFTRLGAEGILAEAARTRGGMRRLLAPVLAASAGLSMLALASNTQLIPRANHRLRLVMSYHADASSRTFKGGREMTVGELRAAARGARAAAHPRVRARAVEYEVEIHKKYALAAASVVLALAAAAFGMRFPSAGPWLVAGASGVVFAGYYACLVAGEQLADQRVLSPSAAMWMANVVLLVLAAIALRRPRSRSA